MKDLFGNGMQQREFKPVTIQQMNKFGLKKENVKITNTIKELKETTPNIVIADCVFNISFVQNWFKKQYLKKKHKYVMGLGVFQQLHYDTLHKIQILKPSNLKFKNIYKPYEGQDLTNKTILFSRTGGVGDLLFLNPILKHLKQKYPTCTIWFGCGPQYQSMLDNWPFIDKILDLPFDFQYLIKADYHAIFEGVIERCKEAEETNAYNLFSKWLGFDLSDDILVPKQEPKEEKVKECEKIIEDWGLEKDSFILMQLRASSPIRTPSIEFWIKMINEITNKGYNIVITDNPKQSDIIKGFIKELDNQDKVFNFSKHSQSLDYSIALTSLAKCVVATDSALIHIAISESVKAFGIYGPFPGKIRLKTYPKNLCDWIDAPGFECTPCFKHGSEPCPRANGKMFAPCYDTIDIKNVVEKIEKLIEKGK